MMTTNYYSSNGPILVCDNGSYSLKVGYSGDDAPRAIIPTVVGKPRKEMSIVGYGQRAMYAGSYAVKNRGILEISNPLKNGVITDWDAMEDIWYHMFYEELLLPPDKFPILHTEPVGNPISCKEKLAEVMFELFNVPSTRLVTKSTVALYGSGSTTGLVVDSGYEDTSVVPIYEGFPLLHAVRGMPIGGLTVTKCLAELLNRRGYSFNTPKDQDMLMYIKENFCHCALNFKSQMASYNKDFEQRYTLPDGMEVEVNAEAFQSPEVIFNPAMFHIDSEHGGLGDLVYKSIEACKIDDQSSMWDNIVLNGGNTLFRSLPERLKVTVAGLSVRSTEKIVISAPPERNYSTWIGGSILALSSNFQHTLVDKQEYEETGSRAVHEKCFL